MKNYLFKTALLLSAICMGMGAFAQTPGSSPGSPAAPGLENVNPHQSPPGGPGGPGYDPPGIDITDPNSPGYKGTNGLPPRSINKDAGDPDKKGLIDKDARAKHIKEDTGIRKDVRQARKEKKVEPDKPASPKK